MKQLFKWVTVIVLFFGLAGCDGENPDELTITEEKYLEEENILKGKIPSSISEDFSLPITGQDSNFKIAWSCNEEGVLFENKVIWSNEDKEITLLYEITYGTNNDANAFRVNGSIIINMQEIIVGDKTIEEIEEIIIDKVPSFTDEDITLLKTAGDASIEWLSTDEAIDENGKVTLPDEAKNVSLIYIITKGDESLDGEIEVFVQGKKTIGETCYEWFSPQIKDFLVSDIINLRYKHNVYDFAEISYESMDLNIVENDGTVHRSLKDETVQILVTVKYFSEIEQFVKTVTVKGMTIYEVMSEAMDYFSETLLENENVRVETGTESELRYLKQYPIVSGDITLPTRYEKYNADITWRSNEENTISSTGKYNKPCIDTIVELVMSVSDGESEISGTYNLCVLGESFNDEWKTVETLLDLIYKEEVSNLYFVMTGFNGDVPNYNYGYIPFYVNTKTNREPYFVSDEFNGKTKPGTKMPQVSWITIHDTANVKADALGHANYIQSGPSSVSWHFTIDDKHIVQHIATDEQAWHAGVGFGNREAIGIETCISKVNDHTVDYNMVMRNVAKLCGELLIQYNLTIDRVHQHYWFSGKNCPAVIRSTGRWTELIELIKIEYLAQKELSDATFVWTSLNPEIMDNSGKVINHPGTETKVGYKVDVTIGTETRTYTFESTLKALSWEK